MGLRRRLRVSRAGLRDTLTLTGSGRVTVRWAFGADFLDVFEVKARELGKPVLFAAAVPPVSLRREWQGGVHRLSAAAGSWSAGVDVSVSPAGVPADDSVSVTVELTPRGGAAARAGRRGRLPRPAAAVPADLDVTLTGVPALGRRWDVTARAGTTTVTPT